VNGGPLISAQDLAAQLADVSVLDVRWELGPGARRDQYLAGHVPGAVFVDLDADLAARAGEGGRHPLPARRAFELAMRRAGVSDSRPVVAYDDASSTAAARAWWLLRYHGHPDVRVLDGGLSAWRDAALPIHTDEPAPRLGDFTARPGAMPVLDAAAAGELARNGVLIDARAAERYRGEAEPIDPVAGHIPGAVNRPTTENVEPSGRFKDRGALRAAFAGLVARPGHPAVGAYCGSGVTAAHEVLALELAGHRAALYPGSWSEWIRDPARPVATGAS
jgi:thiosulfate/3-mercaptopyruvate sulfurtransferase